MPLTQVKRFISRVGPTNLLRFGPTLQVEIYLPESVAKLRGQNPNFPARALIDTGATGTCISPNIAVALNLQPLHQIDMAGVTGIEKSNVYAVDFTFPGSGILVRDWMVWEARNLSKHGFDMLLGRDILKNFLLVYDGVTGEIALECPSESHPLQNEPWVVTQKGGEQQSPELRKIRNEKKRKRKMARDSRKKNR